MEFYVDKYEELELESEKFLDTVSKNIESIRESKGITKLHLSQEMGFMYPDHYSRMELRANGKHFNLKHLYKIAKILEVSISELINPTL